MSDFLLKESWENIERGFEFEAIMLYPSDTKRPLSFFIPDDNDSNSGKISKSIGDFKPQKIDGRFRAIEQQVVVKVKSRRVVVLTDDEINKNEDYEYILVAPINTIKESEKSRDWYSKLKDDEHPIFTYLPNGSLERYVDLTQAVGIHKSLLLQKKQKVDPGRLEVLETNLLQCLSLGIIEEEDFEE